MVVVLAADVDRPEVTWERGTEVAATAVTAACVGAGQPIPALGRASSLVRATPESWACFGGVSAP